MMRNGIATLLVATCIVSGPAWAADAGVKCESGKLKEIGKYFACRLKADAKAATTGGAADYTKCSGKFSSKFTSIETKAGAGVCPTEGNVAAVEQCVAQAAVACAALVRGGQTGCDQGDCTACITCSIAPGAACEDEENACGAEPDCVALADCLQGCFDQACVDTCENNHPTGAPLLLAFSQCIGTECPISCQ